eukprot:jgi/Ulvmu1/4844/UM020_0130.1
MHVMKRVLSVQSHVVSGYVGNKCASFPLQLLGYEVDTINTVQFSNHTGYPSFTGSVVSGDVLRSLTDGLKANGLLVGHTHLLTGYIGSLSFLKEVSNLLTEMRAGNESVVHVCDPVLGDHGHMYVPEDLVDAYVREIVPSATLLTPNQFELELLSQTKVSTMAEAVAACSKMHEMGVDTVVVTSLALDDFADSIVLLGSSRVEQVDTCPFYITVPKLDAYFSGVGDLLAALLLYHTTENPNRLAHATEHAIGSLQSVLQFTAKAAGAASKSTERSSDVMQARELRLVQCQSDILHPVVVHRSQPVTL